MKAPIRVGLPPGLRVLYIERYPAKYAQQYDGLRSVFEEDQGYWRLPLHTNPDRTLGTFMHFYDDGHIEQVTLRSDQPNDEMILIKPKDD